MKKYFVGLAIVLLLGVGGSIFFLQGKDKTTDSLGSTKYSGPVEKITLATSTAAPELSALVMVAQDQKFFTKHGIEVEIQEKESGIVAQREALSGVVDIGATADFAFAGDSFDQPDYRILASIARTNINALIARKDRGITQPSDLKGKKIAVPLNATPEYFLGNFLALNNLLVEDITIVDTAFPKLQESIVSGAVDAVATIYPAAYQTTQALGDNHVTWSTQGGQDFYWILVSNEKYVQQHPDRIKRFLQAIIDADEYSKKNKNAAKTIYQKMTNADPDYLDQTWSKHEFVVELEQSMILAMESQARWIINHKLTQKTTIPNYLPFIHFDALQSLKPGAVSIIH